MDKAQGLSMNTMVLAAIALIILIALVGIFSGYFGGFAEDFRQGRERTCDVTNDKFSYKFECDPATEKEIIGKFKPPLPAGERCCKKTG